MQLRGPQNANDKRPVYGPGNRDYSMARIPAVVRDWLSWSRDVNI